MPFGRRIYAIGGNPAAALYSGIAVDKVRFRLFVVSGLVCAVAGIVYTARLANARANNALGMELDVITIVLLGGVSVWGGKGKLTGVLLGLGPDRHAAQRARHQPDRRRRARAWSSACC